MGDMSLIVRFRLAGDDQLHVQGAARMKVDGRGGLMLYGKNGEMERIPIGTLRTFSIHPIPVRRQGSMAA